MNIRIYNVITRDGYILDKSGVDFLYFTADKKEFKKLYQKADCLLLDLEHYYYLERVGILPATKKFVVVMTTEPGPKGLENVWFTNLAVKQIKREIKIQGYSEVLCLLNTTTIAEFITSKAATDVCLAIYDELEGGGSEKFQLANTLPKKLTPVTKKGKDWERIEYHLKKS